jgi:hypothetical protein
MFQDLVQSVLIRQLAVLLTIVIVLGFAYAALPVSLELPRTLVAYAQLGFMIATMWVATRRFLQEF